MTRLLIALTALCTTAQCAAGVIVLSNTKTFEWGHEESGPGRIRLPFFYGDEFNGYSYLTVEPINIVDVGTTWTITDLNSIDFGLTWDFLTTTITDTRYGHTPWHFTGLQKPELLEGMGRWKVNELQQIEITLDDWFSHPIKSWRTWTYAVTFDGDYVEIPEPSTLILILAMVCSHIATSVRR